MGNYDDIIRLPHPTSKKHPRMSNLDRAAQFSPFAALTGYDAAVQETGRLTDDPIELAEDTMALLDEKLRRLTETGEEAVFTYFQPDQRKRGGAYVRVSGKIKKVDELTRTITLWDGTVLPIDSIREIEASGLDPSSSNPPW